MDETTRCRLRNNLCVKCGLHSPAEERIRCDICIDDHHRLAKLNMVTKKTSFGTVKYKNGVATRNAVYEKVLAFFMKQECFHGECCHQCDNVQIESPDLLTELAENIFEFDVSDEDDDEFD